MKVGTIHPLDKSGGLPYPLPHVIKAFIGQVSEMNVAKILNSQLFRHYEPQFFYNFFLMFRQFLND
jgi:hypothetical protein